MMPFTLHGGLALGLSLLTRFTRFPLQAEPDPLMEWWATILNDVALAGMKAAATVFWALEKIGAGITRFLVQQDMWEVVLNSVMNSLRTITPGILRDLVFGIQGGGLFYLALMLAGIFLIIPQLGRSRPVDAGHAIFWLGLMVSLFISSTSGFDLIQGIEGLRADTVGILNPNGSSSLDDLIARPMLADSSDLLTYDLVLPRAFEAEYFTNDREMEWEEILWGVEIPYETDSSRTQRREAAQTGVALAALTLLPGVTLLLFGIIFATLTASALVLITFFIVSLPLGFFEFGSHILLGIARQYVYLWAITLLAVILPSILRAAGTLTYPTSGAPSLNDLMSFIPVLVIVTIATSYVSAMATRTLTETLHVVNTSVRSAMAPMAEYTGLPVQDTLSRVGHSVSNTVGDAGRAAGNISSATFSALLQSRNVGTALAAGTGALLGNLNAKGGQAAALLAREMVATPRGDVFAEAAENPAAKGMVGTAHVAMTAYHARFGRRTRRNEFWSGGGTGTPRTGDARTPRATANPDAQDPPPEDANTPNGTAADPQDPTREYETAPAPGDIPTRRHATVGATPNPQVGMPTPYGIQQAHSLLIRQNERLARADYQRLFRDAGLAEDLVQYHQQAGVRGMNLTQAAVSETQAVVTEQMQAGQPYLNSAGEVLPTLRAEALRRLEAGGTAMMPEERPLLERVMARSVHTRMTPSAAIAPQVLEPYHLKGDRDIAAYYALNDIAQSEGWNREVVQDVLDATYYGHLTAEADGENPQYRAARLLQQLPELRTLQGDQRTEIARLARLVLQDHASHPRTEPHARPQSDATPPFTGETA